MHKIPVTVVTGFLGAGKTTLIRHLLQNNRGRRIAVLVNEFGEVGIDGELLRSCQICDETDEPDRNILELSNGCLCCTVQEEFLPTMQQLMQRRDRLDCIVIETSGLALPKPLVKAFRWPEICTQATVDGVVTVVDCEALANGQVVGALEALEAQRRADESIEHETPIEELFEDQLACADMVLLAKGDRVDASSQRRVIQWLEGQIKSGVKVIPCQQGEISPEILLGFNASVEDNLGSRPSHHDDEEEHDHDDDIQSFCLALDRVFDPAELVARLEALVKQQEIYRIKGFVDIPGKAMRLAIQGVGQRFDSFYDRPWRATDRRQTQLVFIGRNLDRERIAASVS
ncbi:cobalamin biosynthesis protein CobW [Synechococcus sp. PCC 7336]|uniref:cobalamin biosynthesis protein CobW n=1 Tax=Synechococcus sp. PCC 7336 TaxID=195250 RepID=UPI0003467570|nr:cobalamin biosynthesis protein CobW [Synechococcus sp. PCC 7336]